MQTHTPHSLPADAVMPSLPQDIAVVVLGVVIGAMLLHGFALLRRDGDNRLLVLLGSGAAASLLEGFACHLINCWHSAVGIREVYVAFGIHVPLWLAELYVVFFGGMSYYFLRGFVKSASFATLFWSFFIVVGMLEGGGEMIGIALGMFVYHGAQPLPIFGFPLYLGFINPAQALAFTAVACLWFKHVKGGARYLLIPLTPVLLAGVYAGLTYPTASFLFAANHGLSVAGSIASMILSVLLAALSYRVLMHLHDQGALVA